MPDQRPRPSIFIPLLAGILACLSVVVSAQTPAPAPTIPAIFLSDLHFDPFRDPAKVPRLLEAPIEAWPAILDEPDSPNRDAAYANLQKKCSGTGQDTSYALLVSALRAAHAQVPDARFVTITGDFIAHHFDCHFGRMFPGRGMPAYRPFVEKTLRFTAAQLRQAFPAIPIYATFGNNDSDCGDYHLDPGGPFLHDLAPLLIGDLARATGPARTAALASFTANGDYSLNLPAPMQHARLIAIDNIYQSDLYRNCHSRANPTAEIAASQIAWLRAQLTDARRHHQQVWVIGHVPPGIDLYTTVIRARDVCSGQPPATFLSSPAMDNALLSGAGIIRLTLLAHTHMDEMRLLKPSGPTAGTTADDIPIKLVSSISPSNGNTPSFTTARIRPATATLTDYTVYIASNRTGLATQWNKEYSYGETYHQPAFDGIALDKLTTQFLNDRAAATPESKAYIRNYFAGLGSALTPMWPAYVCTLTHTTPQSYTACLCQK